MKFIKGKYEKALRENENVYDFKGLKIGDYFLQKEKDFVVSLNQIVFDKEWENEDLRDISIRDYTEIQEIAKFNQNDYEKLSCNDMRGMIANAK